jgi:SPX domain protein involved in polyphosphate accumulation
MLHSKEQAEPLRYERKFLITGYSHKDVEHMIKFHPACFSEIFHQRSVNNIYFDTPGFNHYYDNVEGSQNRLKVRIRWYDDLFGTITQPILEHKIKKGLLGKKDSYVLQPFTLDEHFDRRQILAAIDHTSVPAQVKDELLSLRPVLLNSYTRKYFLSADKNFRITIDHELTYYRISYGGNTFTNRSADHHATVLELKYDAALEQEAKEIGSMFPFLMTKNSKYLTGLEKLFL